MQFHPNILEVVNNSHLHSGHFIAQNSEHINQTHFMIKISAECFKGLNKIEIHRKINHLLKDEFKNGLHALEIKVLSDL